MTFDYERGKKLPAHPELKQYHINWEFWGASYEVDHRYISVEDTRGNPIIKKFHCESVDDYRHRKAITTPTPYVSQIINRYNSFVFRSEIKRSDAHPLYSELIDDADLRGTSLTEFMRKQLLEAQVDGWSWAILDSTAVKENMTYLPAQVEPIRPFLMRVPKSCIVNWERRDGVLVAALVTMINSEGIRFAREITMKEYRDIIIDEKDKVIEVGEWLAHGYESIPIIETRPNLTIGRSQVAPIADQQADITNLLSLERTEIQENTYTRWVLSGVDPELQDGDDRKGKREDLATRIGNSRFMIIYGEDGRGASLSRIGSDVSQADSIRSAIERAEEALYRTAGLRETASGTASGLSRMLEFASDSAVLIDALKSACEAAENYIVQLLNSEAWNLELLPVDYGETILGYSFEQDTQLVISVLNSSMPAVVKRLLVSQYIEKNIDVPEGAREALQQNIDNLFDEPA
jgi:hypothetical protein